MVSTAVAAQKRKLVYYASHIIAAMIALIYINNQLKQLERIYVSNMKTKTEFIAAVSKFLISVSGRILKLYGIIYKNLTAISSLDPSYLLGSATGTATALTLATTRRIRSGKFKLNIKNVGPIGTAAMIGSGLPSPQTLKMIEKTANFIISQSEMIYDKRGRLLPATAAFDMVQGTKFISTLDDSIRSVLTLLFKILLSVRTRIIVTPAMYSSYKLAMKLGKKSGIKLLNRGSKSQ